jgi:hypothetical protein
LKIFFGFFNPFFLCVLDKGYNSIETAKRLIKMGLSPQQVSTGTSLSMEEVLRLFNEK